MKTFLVTKRVAVGAIELIPKDLGVKFQADADVEVKSAVASYLLCVLLILLGQSVGPKSLYFLGVEVTKEKLQ